MLTTIRIARATCAALVLCAATALPAPAQINSLYSFDGSDGRSPYAGLVQATDGNFYGTTVAGGANGWGTVFQITPSGTLNTLHSFCSVAECADGLQPYAGLVQATDGNLYGTTYGGGTYGAGTVFKITLGGTLTTLYAFGSQRGDGYYPYAGLVQATDGNFYGTTNGTVFKITPTGTMTTLYSFSGLDGSEPQAPLVQATDGNLYGITVEGGSNDDGTVFQITLTGTLTTLHSFYGPDGANPSAGLVQGTDGSLYGTTAGGGAYGSYGTVFSITPSGTLTTLHSFCYGGGQCADGDLPLASLVQATDGNFYGTTSGGGQGADGGYGTVFKISPQPPYTLTTLYSFPCSQGCPAGDGPDAGLVQATEGTFYGTTAGGGANNDGTIFTLTAPSPTAVQFVPFTPCRLVDTRKTKTPIQGGTSQFFNVPELGDCNIPATAAAYSLNVTVVPQEPLDYLTIWPAGRPQPYVSTMNSPDGRTKANAAIVPAGANAAVSVYAANTTDVILDIDGYFTAPGSQTYDFYSVAPCRVVDTRAGSNEPEGLGPPRLGANQVRDLPILSSPCLQGITNPLAYSFNVTVVPNPTGQLLGYLTIWPSNQMQPTVSTLNNPTATVVANAAIVSAAPDGDIDVYAYDSTDLIIDINGYFAAPGQNGLSLYPVAPCRVLDTRNNDGKPFQGIKVVPVEGSPCAPPSNAQTYVFNATVVPPGSMPFLTLWADGQPQPVVSTLNAYDGFITSNMAIVPTTNGSIDAYAAGLTQLILDISGYFAP